MKHLSDFPKIQTADRIFAVLYLLIGYGFVYAFTSREPERNLAVFTVFYAAAVLGYLYRKGICPPKESWFWLAAMLAMGIPFAFWSVLYIFQILGLMVTAAYWTLLASGRLLEKDRTSQWVFFDCWNGLFMVPFGNFSCQLRVLAGSQGAEDGEEKKEKKGSGILLGILLAVPVLIVVLPLLSSADAGFERMAGGLVAYIRENLMEVFLRALFAVPVAAYLYGLVFGGVSGRNTDRIQKEQLQETERYVRKIPDTAVCTVLAILCMIYLVFTGLQGSYLFSAFAGRIPEDFTYAEYARRGFFELCQIGLCNLVVIGCAGLFSRSRSTQNRGLACLTVLLSVFTLLLIGTAVSKLGMYMSVYGLTVNRILPLVFLLWMVLVFVLLIFRQKRAFPMVRICVMAGAVLFCLLCVFPVEAWTDAYNVWARGRGYIV
ncbi:MAG: DUF4173 domain-containing protein [Clostridiales bacterium]|nr:DUF4173 domain-containing protein [Clostridiales bacterium]